MKRLLTRAAPIGAATVRERSSHRGQAALEFALLYSAVILPLTFMGVFVAEMLWTWHSVADLTRRGAQFAATSCWTADGSAGNVIAYMQTTVPPMIDMDQFQNGAAGIQVQYFTQNPDGTLTAFDGNNCGGGVCIPDSVSVSVTTYQYRRFSGFFKLGPVTMPPFTTTVPMESAGYRDASGTCTE
jgi:hypothetical protein